MIHISIKVIKNSLIFLQRLKSMLAFVFMCVFLTACGGGSDSSSSNARTTSNENLSGLWNGTISEGGKTYATRGLIFDEDANDGLPADFYAISLDAEAIYLGSISVTGDYLEGSAGMYHTSEGYFGQSTITGEGNGKGIIQATGIANYGSVSAISLEYDNSYDRPSSLDTISGVWDSYDDYGRLAASMTIQNNGSFQGDNAGGCQFDGDFSIINSNQNLYRFELEYFGCVLDGYVAEGYAAFFDENGADDRMETVYKVANNGQTQAVVFLEISRSAY
jgi:hypothetical protein